MKLKKARIIILPANDLKNGELLIHKSYDIEKHLWLTEVDLKEDNTVWIPQHLYFTTDEEIIEGDWRYDLVSKTVILTTKHTDRSLIRDNCRKIIATTDTKLKSTIQTENNYKISKTYLTKPLPQPSKVFIEKYCKASGIDEVIIEYEEQRVIINTSPRVEEGWMLPKVDSHNTITIHPIKNSWTKEEVTALIAKY